MSSRIRVRLPARWFEVVTAALNRRDGGSGERRVRSSRSRSARTVRGGWRWWVRASAASRRAMRSVQFLDPALGWGDDEGAASEAFDILGSPTQGTFAERVVVPAINVHAKPAALSWEEAAAFPLAGLTAWRAVVTCARAAPGRRLLVTGGGSGVSTFCVQIAHALGAEVWVTSGDDAKIARCVELGARGGFRYDDPEWPAQVRAATNGVGVHAVVDSFGGEGVGEGARRAGSRRRARELRLYTGGDEATIPVAALYWQWRSLVGTTMGSPNEFRVLCKHVASAAWRPAIDSVHALEDVAAAAQRLTAPSRFGESRATRHVEGRGKRACVAGRKTAARRLLAYRLSPGRGWPVTRRRRRGAIRRGCL